MEILKGDVMLTKNRVVIGDVVFGGDSVVFVGGPCAIEGHDMAFRVCEVLVDECSRREIPFVFKASFDKANRMSVSSPRGVGLDAGLRILDDIKEEFGVVLVTDVHGLEEVDAVADVVDILQIPAFLCRQTDLILGSSKKELVINIKKGQFMAPEDMAYAAEKVRSVGNERVLLTERGTSFGYRDIVLDPRGVLLMGESGCPVLLDVTHTTQRPGAGGGVSGGDRRFTPHFIKLGLALGVDGIYMEAHPNPDEAISDKGSQIPLGDVASMLDIIAGFTAFDSE